MSKELADSPTVLAAQKMERNNEVEVISVIRHYIDEKYRIHCPEPKIFNSFENAYNYLAMKGYHRVSSDENTYFKTLLEVAKTETEDTFIMVMSKKMNK
jgi:hypothetical protein